MSGVLIGDRPTIADALRHGADRLVDVADHPRREARLLLAHALGLTQNDLIRDPSRRIDLCNFSALLARRAASEPLAHITGRREFWSMEFAVSKATLIPRPESETLVEAALAAFASRPPPRRILDLGTGTGCLLLALLQEFPDAFGLGIDLAPEAAALAQTNARRLGFATRAAFAAASWTDALSPVPTLPDLASPDTWQPTSLAGGFDLVVSNPPYIAASDITTLMPDVARYEPRLALDGGADGFSAYRTLIADLGRIMTPDAVAVLELGAGQAIVVSDLGRSAGFEVSTRPDLADITRAVVLTRPTR